MRRGIWDAPGELDFGCSWRSIISRNPLQISISSGKVLLCERQNAQGINPHEYVGSPHLDAFQPLIDP